MLKSTTLRKENIPNNVIQEEAHVMVDKIITQDELELQHHKTGY